MNIDNLDDTFIGELIGLFVGDGNLFFDKKSYGYTIRYFFNVTEKNYVNYVSNLFLANLKKEPHISKNLNVLVLRYYSKNLFNFILNYVSWGISRDVKGNNRKSRTVYLKDSIFSKNFKIGFLRGFIDSDGYISNKKVLFASASEKIMLQTKKFLEDTGFRYFKLSFYKDKRENRIGMWHLYIHSKERTKFFNLIKPKNLTKCADRDLNPDHRLSS